MIPHSYLPRVSRVALVAAACAALPLFGLTTKAEAKMPNIKKTSNVTITFDLAPTTAAPVEADGTATIDLHEGRKATSAEIALNVTGLAAGTYSVDAALEDASTLHIGEITIAAPAETVATGVDDAETTEVVDENELELTLPATVDARDIATLTVGSTDATTGALTVLLTGDASASTSSLSFFANVRVTAPPASVLTTTPSATDDTDADDGKGKGSGKVKVAKAKKVHGHALAKQTVTDGVETRHFFLLVAQGAPASTLLNIVVDGETVGTVTSTKQGKVMFKSLPDVDLASIDLLTITGADGVAVMQADF